jgi:protein gp37
MIFVNSMSHLFHKEVPKHYIARVFDTMEQADWHIYQVLTKRSSLLQKGGTRSVTGWLPRSVALRLAPYPTPPRPLRRHPAS